MLKNYKFFCALTMLLLLTFTVVKAEEKVKLSDSRKSATVQPTVERRMAVSTLLINEVDADQYSTDSNEFVELYDGGVGNTSLDGYVLVLFNGSDDASYDAYDLDGYSTDANGFFVIGSSMVPNVTYAAWSSNGLQNGADAVALYSGDATSFPGDTPLSTTNLIDAFVYDTNDGDDSGLLALLNTGQAQINEDDGGDKDNHSSARSTDGAGGARNTSSYVQQTPTPGTSNSAAPATIVAFETSSVSVSEDAGTYSLNVTIENPSADNATSVDVQISSGDNTDVDTYSTQTLTFAAGSSDMQSVRLTLTDDATEEGTETITFELANVSGGESATADAGTFELTILDNDGAYASSSLIISQYIETNSGSTPKGIEVLNVSGSAIDFSVTPLDFQKGSNGGELSTRTTVDSGVLPDGEVWVIGTGDLGTFMDTTQAGASEYYTEFGATFNGDDALAIVLDGVIQDVIGVPGVDPGSEWNANSVSTKNQNIQLKTSVTEGDTDGWSDPSERFEYVAEGTMPTGFGVAPGETAVAPTIVQLAETSATVNEEAGTVSLTLELNNPSSTEATTVAVALTSGEAADVNNYTTQTLTFAAGNSTAQTLDLTITDDAEVEDIEVLTFALTVSGGESAQALNGPFELTIIDNDATGPVSDIIISQYVEDLNGDGLYYKGLELWNISGEDIDFSVTPLLIKKGYNGNATSDVTTLSTGILKADSVWIIGKEDVLTYLSENNLATNRFTQYDFTFNGDDALEIYLDGNLQDVFGLVGEDPGSGWSGNGVQTNEQNIALKESITDGDLDGWTDPSTRFEKVSDGDVIYGFGVAPGDVDFVPYYSTIGDKAGAELKAALHDLIKAHTRFEYTATSTDVWDILKETDEDPANPDNVILLYSGRSEAKSNQDNGSSGNDAWNREHVWPKSHGFPNESDTAYTDVHHLRPTDKTINSSRGNKDFDNGGTAQGEAPDTYADSDSWEPRDEIKGDVARMIFYMAVRYEDGPYNLEIVDYTGTSTEPVLGKISTLLAWHQADPVDDWEKSRNNLVYQYQGNRNPFIDHPEYAELVFVEEDPVAPVLNSSLEAQSVNHGLAFNYSFAADLFRDANTGDQITYSATLADGSNLPAWLSFDAENRTFSGTPAKEDAGELTVKVIATDNGGLTGSTTFTLTVEDEFDVLVYNNFDDCEITGWTAYSVSSAKDWACTSYGFDGTSAYQMNAYGQSVTSEDWLITPQIDLTAVDAPVFSMKTAKKYGDSPLEILVSTDYTVGTDPTTASWTSLELIEDADFDDDTWTDILVDLSSEIGSQVAVGIKYYAESNTTRWTIDEALIKDVPTDNVAPVVNGSIEDMMLNVGLPLDLELDNALFTDQNTGDVLTLSAALTSGAALPGWLSFDAATGAFAGTPAEANVGAYEVKVTATDSEGLSAFTTFTLTVSNDFDVLAFESFNHCDQASWSAYSEGSTKDWSCTSDGYNDSNGYQMNGYQQAEASNDWLISPQLDLTTAQLPRLNFMAETYYGGNMIEVLASTDYDGTSAPSTANWDTLALELPSLYSGEWTEVQADLFEYAGSQVYLAFSYYSADNPSRWTVDNLLVKTNDFTLTLADQAATEDSEFSYTFEASTDAAIMLRATKADGSALPSWLTFDADTKSFSGMPDNAQVGSFEVLVTANNLVSGQFALEVINTNDAPVAETIADQTTTEDEAFSFDVASNFTDVDASDQLSFSATVNGEELPSWLSLDASTAIFSGTPENSDVAVYELLVTATDLAGAEVSESFTLTVENSNDAPLAEAIADQTATEDEAYSFAVASSFTDVDANDELSLSATLSNGEQLPSWLSFEASTATFSGTPVNADVAAYELLVTATDLAGAEVSESFTLTVENSNDAPLAEAIADQSATEDEAFNLAVASNFSDEDANDELSFSAMLSNGNALPAWLSLNEGVFTGTPANEDVANYEIKVTATDLANQSASFTFPLTVNNVNDAPVVANGFENQTALQDRAFTFTFAENVFLDVDADDELTYSATVSNGSELPAWLSFDAANRTFSGTPSSSDLQIFDIDLKATDLAGAQVTYTFSLRVENLSGGPVVLNEIEKQQANEDAVFSFTFSDQVFASQYGETNLSYSALMGDSSSLPNWLTFNASTQNFSATPTNELVGLYTIRLIATDTAGESITEEFLIEVVNVNDAPVLISDLNDQSINEDETFSFTISDAIFLDVDADDELTVSAALASGEALPAWLTFEAGTFSATPSNEAVGIYELKVTATDLAGSSIFATFKLTVENVNDAPQVTALEGQTIAEDQAFSYRVADHFTDVDADDELTLNAALASGDALPSWLIFESGAFSGTPSNEEVGSYELKVTATDLAGSSIASTFMLTVENVNDTPQVTALEDQTAKEDEAFSYKVSAHFTDVDAEDELTLSAALVSGDALPSWLIFESGAFSGTPSNEEVGSYELKVTATDLAGSSIASTFRLRVENANDAPRVSGLEDMTVTEDQAFSFSVAAQFTDVDTDVDARESLTLTATLASGETLPSWLAFEAASGEFSGMPSNEVIGTYTIRVAAEDIAGARVSSTFTLTVENVNDAPQAGIIADQTAIEDQAFSLEVANTFSDVDAGDELTLTAALSSGADLPDFLTFKAESAQFSASPSNDDVGSYEIAITVTDLAGASAVSIFTLTVENVNDAPLYIGTQLPGAIVTAGELLNISLPFELFEDEDAGDVLTLSATLEGGESLPDWLSFDSGERQLYGTPADGLEGEYTVVITATDSEGATASTTFLLTVNPAEVLATTPGQELRVKAFPNPAFDVLKINATEKVKLLGIYTLGGQLMLSKQNVEQEDLRLNVSTLSRGVYILRVITENEVISRKIQLK